MVGLSSCVGEADSSGGRGVTATSSALEQLTARAAAEEADAGTDATSRIGDDEVQPLAPAANVSLADEAAALRENPTDDALVADRRREAGESIRSGAVLASEVVVGHVDRRMTHQSTEFLDWISYEDHTSLASISLLRTLSGSHVPGEVITVRYRHNAENSVLRLGSNVLLLLDRGDNGEMVLSRAAQTAGVRRAWQMLDDVTIRATNEPVIALANLLNGIDVNEVPR